MLAAMEIFATNRRRHFIPDSFGFIGVFACNDRYKDVVCVRGYEKCTRLSYFVGPSYKRQGLGKCVFLGDHKQKHLSGQVLEGKEAIGLYYFRQDVRTWTRV